MCIAAALALAAAISLYATHRMQAAIIAEASRENIILYQYINKLTPRYQQSITNGVMAAELTYTLQFLPPLHTLRLYNTHGLLLYTTGGTMLAADFARDTAAGTILHGQITQEGKTWLRSFMPLTTPSGQTTAYLELLHDITAATNATLRSALLIAISTFAACILTMVLARAVWRGPDSGMARLHEENLELIKAADAAETALRDKTQFLATISHELRTPLNAIIGFSELIKTGAVPSDSQQAADYISDIHQSGVHLLGMINDILDFSKAEAGKLELEIEEVNATKLAVNCLRLVQPRAETGKIELVNALPKQNLVLETDGKKLKQVLLNLLSNAVKFTPEGGKVRLAIWPDEEEDRFVFQVSDSGVGIQPKNIARALSQFGQVENTLSKRYEGTGLGLPLARKFVEVMGGRFGIQSEEGQGTVIFFALPRVFKAHEGVLFTRVPT